MADESYLLSLAVNASDDLAAVKGDLASVKEILTSFAEVTLPDESELSLYAAGDANAGSPDDSASEVVAVPDGFYDDLLSFQAAQAVIGLFVVAALLLNFGALLWLSFSDKWRS